MPKQPLFITTVISNDIVCIMRNGLLNGKLSWSTKELVDGLKRVYGNNVTDRKIRYILEEYQGCESTPWWKSVNKNKIMWELNE